ncbi:MAG TPA: cytochrome c peroxidase [Saprospiraceae bacterium]|nr:cytochrome c peroxidase [Saprospiraceae bacterium]
MRRWLIIISILCLLTAFVVAHKPSPYEFPKLNYFPQMPQSSENPVTIEGADLGRHLFYDPILSKNKDISCASCHRQEMAFSDAPNTFTKGNEGMLTNRNTMPLFNLAWYAALFWDGRASSIEDQVYHPVRDRNEMNIAWTEAENRIKALEFYQHKFRLAFGIQEIDSVLISKAIGQFLRTLISNQSKYDRVLAGNDYLNKDEYAGFVLMNDMTKGDCLHCHTTDGDALGTTGKFSNNGLDNVKDPNMYRDKGLGGYTTKENDNGKFKIPSLRNVAITAPYMHDGRFATLEEVLDFYSDGVQTSANIDAKMGLAHQGGVRLTLSEKKQIIAFLNTLTDSLFITNPKYSNPFKN